MSVVSASLAVEHPVLTENSSGATNVSWLIPSTKGQSYLMTYQSTPVLPQHIMNVTGRPVTTSLDLILHAANN